MPITQLPTDAMPCASVVAVGPVTDPPPDQTANETWAPGKGAPPLSVTVTDGGTGAAAPTTAVWSSPEATPTAAAPELGSLKHAANSMAVNRKNAVVWIAIVIGSPYLQE